MKTQQELQLHYWGPHYDMVKEYNAKHGADIKPWECVNSNATRGHPDHPRFTFDTECYHFALTILYDDKRKEHRPVFVGDRLYSKFSDDIVTVTEPAVTAWVETLSWNPPTPKRMFKLNDLELNSPVRKGEGEYIAKVGGNEYYFTNYNDRNALEEALRDILTAARDKE